MRLLSWNIHKGIGGRDRPYSLARIIDCIEAENPDVICLQEMDRHVRRSRQGAGQNRRYSLQHSCNHTPCVVNENYALLG